MPVDTKKEVKLEPQPLKAISMPEYRYQEYVVTEFSSSDNCAGNDKKESIDLSGVALNLL